MFGAVQVLNVLILTLLYVQLFNSVKVNEFPPLWERAANSAYHLLFHCMFIVCLSIVSFDVLDKLWFSGVSLLIYLL